MKLSLLIPAVAILSVVSGAPTGAPTGSPTATPPENDLCQDAIIVDPGTSVSGDTSHATFDNVGNCGTSNTAPGLWYKFTPDCDGVVSLSTVSTCGEGTTFDTKISVFTGSCGALECVTGSDDAGPCGFQTEFEFPTVDGQTYYVLVHGFSSQTGQFDLEISTVCQTVPANDFCPDAEPLCRGSTVVGDTTYATPEELLACGNSSTFGTSSTNGLWASNGVWYSFISVGGTIDMTLNAELSTCGENTTFDTQINVYKGTCDSLECVDGSDDGGPCGLQTEFSFMTEPDTKYYVLVNGFASSNGKFQLVLSGDGVRDNKCGAHGDPHFKTWTGNWFDYHGECDLVLVHAPNFGLGLGLDIHIRTTIEHEYSNIETVALKIGEDSMEISSYGKYMINGVPVPGMPALLAGLYPVVHTKLSRKRDKFTIQVSNRESIIVSSIKNVLSVQVENASYGNFAGSVGLMGDFEKGQMLSRNSTMVLKDHNTFGQEWQVLDDEPMLFQTNRFPQYPQTCTLPPPKASDHRRRLGESIPREKAEMVCGHYDGDEKMKSMCVSDVLATGDIEMATPF